MPKKKNTTPIRVNILFFSVFILFSLLVLRLGIVQIVHGEDYKREINRKEDVTVNNPVPRGKMLDRNHKVIVDNKPLNAITYTNEGASQKEMLQVAAKLARIIEKDTDKVRERDMKDFWMIKHPEEAKKLIKDKEMELFRNKKLKNKDLYKLQLERVTKNHLSQLTEQDIEELAIFSIMNSGYKFVPQIIKNEGVTQEEYALVNENLSLLPGVNAATDWDREYKYEEAFKPVLGRITTSSEGLPAERLDYFMSRGYTRNDRVGKSNLELEYEDVLQGKKEKIVNVTDKAGELLEKELVSEGQRGKDLVLSIDMDLQLAVEEIVEKELWAAKRSPGTGLLDSAYVVLMDPNTGEVLTMAGKRIVKDKKTKEVYMEDDALGNILKTFNVGSVVKGATVFTGYKTGAISSTTRFDDRALDIKGTPIKKSYSYLGVLNDIDALKRSSNVYMFHTAIRIGNGVYRYQQPLNLDPKVWDTIRNSFASFGLGIRTGIDLPNEQTGAKGANYPVGKVLDLVIGQYDTYSNMQLAQYISTIANGGYRMQPKIVKEIREPAMNGEELGPIYKSYSPNVLNDIGAKDQWLDRVHTGFKKVMQEPGGTAYRYFSTATYSPAGKTGTAEAFYDGQYRVKGDALIDTMNLSLVGYAPSDNPEIAMAVIVPWAYQGSVDHGANKKIGRAVMDAYFNMKNGTEQPTDETED
ncbi:peptidoglycan D,D-transpeptidase FtsI family protein [Mesobacillus selenatarsenatis]|uniref:serine-type D-Ala-D-Ala carboxypeptidase n=1 Tax=Mesobacillus selenatarsenatis (strain DSM 18680 / JCM 14380 / FERM P-15431 / SF-1) TaxID=1321606 RepID=A0A0A8X3W7_MESS1|nr:penicillin-binding protein 2 [Mesobacillus selenatarsenatis]GAM13904.1 cell division protein FtsI [peptidoglycan synthetase] /transpeptidase, penicillin binding protein transpeptidase domain [Mesobacillus selenatarsenatis SF-1]